MRPRAVSPSSIVLKFWIICFHVEINPLPLAFPFSPAILLIWEEAMVSTAPAVNPIVTGSEIKLMKNPTKEQFKLFSISFHLLKQNVTLILSQIFFNLSYLNVENHKSIRRLRSRNPEE